MSRCLRGRQRGGSGKKVAAGEAALVERFKSNSGKICWSSEAHGVDGRAAAARVITMTPGSPGLALPTARDIKESLEPFMLFS